LFIAIPSMPTMNRSFLLVAILIATLILHGSLYPYAFAVSSGRIGPLDTLLNSWATPPSGFGDLVANILLYMPFGFFAVLATNAKRRVLWVTATGLLLCVAVELAQFYDSGRVTNMSDVYLNTLGTWIGAMSGAAAGSRSIFGRALLLRAVPTILLVAFLGYRLFPYVPTIDLHKYWNALKPIVLHPVLAPIAIFHYFALWLTASFLVAQAAAGAQRPLAFVALLMTFVLGAKVLIVSQAVTLPEIAGAALALAAWAAIWHRPRAAVLLVAAVLCAAILAFRLQPFDFRASSSAFGWLPFRSFLGGSLETDISSFFEKFFLYGSLIWVGAQAGLRLWPATFLVAAMLFATSVVETHLPGRSAEISDALIALITGVVFTALTRSPQEASSARSPHTVR
jgi:VanZ family protein